MIREERIVTLDILRGLALFGMILVHFHQRMEIPSSGIEDIVGWVIWMGLETKSWATFALLFGAGFAILMRRAEARGLRVVPLFLRRMLMLGIIGAAVQVLTGFHILIEYAIWGVPLLFIRNAPTKLLLAIALVAAAAMSVYSTFSPYSRGPYWQQLKDVEEHGTFTQAVTVRAQDMRWQYAQPRAFIPGSSFVLFILGLLAVRHRVFDDPRSKRSLIIGAMLFGLLSWAIVWFVLPKIGIEDGYGIISEQWLALTYIGAIVLLVESRPWWAGRLSAFAKTGRMALTNYVLQAAILSLLACGYGLGLRIRPWLELPAAILLFLILFFLSTFWLRRFAYGPLEGIWRSFTYWRFQGE
jgi:uncharacterized protein